MSTLNGRPFTGAYSQLSPQHKRAVSAKVVDFLEWLEMHRLEQEMGSEDTKADDADPSTEAEWLELMAA